jgi:hypothetical protein
MHNLHKKLAKLSVIAALFASCTSDFDDIPEYKDIPKYSDIEYCIWETPLGVEKCNKLIEVGEEFCVDFGTIVKGDELDDDGPCQTPSSSSAATPSSSSSGTLPWTGYCEAEIPSFGLQCFQAASEEECLEWTNGKAVASCE